MQYGNEAAAAEERQDVMKKEVEVDILLTVRDLYRFTLRHTYTGFSGIIGLIISIGAIVLLVCNFEQYDSLVSLALLIIGLTFTVLQPLMLHAKVKKQMKRTGSFAMPLYYRINEEGIMVSQNDEVVLLEWPEVRRLVKTKKAVYIYMSPVRAFIFPTDQCGGQQKLLVDIAGECLAKVRSGEIVFTDRYHKEFEKEQEEKQDE